MCRVSHNPSFLRAAYAHPTPGRKRANCANRELAIRNSRGMAPPILLSELIGLAWGIKVIGDTQQVVCGTACWPWKTTHRISTPRRCCTGPRIAQFAHARSHEITRDEI